MLLTEPATVTDTATGRHTQWVRLLPPGVTDRDARIAPSLGDLLADALTTILRSAQSNLQAIDLLCYSGRAHQEYLLRACPAATVTPAVALPTPDTGDTIETDETDPARLPATFGLLLADELIDRIGLELVKFDPTPLGRTPTLTTRVLTSSTAPISIERSSSHSCLATYLARLTEQSIPHVSRTILAPAGPDSYHVEQQVGEFAPSARTLTRTDLAAHTQQETTPSLAAQYDTDVVTSTWEQLTETGWEVATPSQGAPRQPTLRRQRDASGVAATLYDLCTSATEYQRLLGTLGDPAPLAAQYEDLAYTPTLEVTADSLSAMLGLVWGYDSAPWQTQLAFDRRPPALDPVACIRSAPGTDRTAGHVPRVPVGGASSSGLWAPAAATVGDWPQATAARGQGPGEHGDFTQRAMKRLREYGDSILAAGETFGDAPWVSGIRETPTGEQSVLVIDETGTIPPGELVAAASHGAPEHTITVVTETRAAAERAAAILERPFGVADGAETVLYPRTARCWITNGYVGVLPRTASIQWTVDPHGHVRLIVDGAVVAGGTFQGDELTPLEADSDTATPVRWLDPDPSLTVYESDGTVCDQYPDQRSLREAYRSIPLPAVPARRWWTARASCVVLGADGPSVYDPLRMIQPSSFDDSHNPVVREFVDTYTCAADQTLEGTTVAAAYRRYLSPQSGTRLPGLLNVVERIADISPQVRGRSAYDSALEKPESMRLTQRDWIYPDVTSGRPAVPFADATATAGPVVSLAQSLAVDTTDEPNELEHY